jgi:hypothetical protein
MAIGIHGNYVEAEHAQAGQLYFPGIAVGIAGKLGGRKSTTWAPIFTGIAI